MAEIGKLNSALRGVTMVGTGSAAPEKVLSNADLEKMVDTNDDWIVTRTGIRERRIARDDEAVSDLARDASMRALEMAKLRPTDVDTIILATVTPDRMLPSAACTLQQSLGATNAAAFDLNAACSGFLYGLSVGTSMISSGLAETVLLVGAETLSKIIDYQDRSTCILFGDAAGAVVLRPSESGQGIHSVRLMSDGTQGDLLEIPAGGSRQPASHETVDARGHYVKMRGNELFKFAVRSMEAVTRDTLAASGLTVDDLKLLIPHQANRRIIKAVADRLGIPMEQVVVNLDRYGNTSAASIPVSLDEVVRNGRLAKGDRFAMVAFGGGVTWGAAISDWDPARALRIEREDETREMAIPTHARRNG